MSCRKSNLPAPLPDHDVAIVIASDSDDAATRCARSIGPPRAGRGRCSIRRSVSAISIATSCIACSTELTAWIFRQRSLCRARNCFAMSTRPMLSRASHPISHFLSLSGRVDRMRASGLPRSTIAPRSMRYLEARPEQEFFIARFVDYSERRRPVSQVPDRLRRWPALRMPHGDRRSLGHLVSQRRHVAAAQASVSKKRPSCAHSTSASRAAIGPR